jgi:hypothetical protein
VAHVDGARGAAIADGGSMTPSPYFAVMINRARTPSPTLTPAAGYIGDVVARPA